MKKSDILTMPTMAYYSGLNGLEIKGVLYGIDDKIMCVSGAWSGSKKAHILKIYYGRRDDDTYIKLHGYKIPLNECIRM